MAHQAQDVALHLDPYAALGCAVLRQALMDSRLPGLTGTEARAFLIDEDCRLWADLLGLDPAALAARIAQAGA